MGCQTSSSTSYTAYPDHYSTEDLLDLSEEDYCFLSHFLKPYYLTPKSLKQLSTRFSEESSLELHDFLKAALAAKLQSGLRDCDKRDGLDYESRSGLLPSHSSGTDKETWTLRGPPHKFRYCVLSPVSPSFPKYEEERIALLSSPDSTPEQVLYVIQNTLFPSSAFRSWLALCTSLLPVRYSVLARRFRPGLDYTLATSNDDDFVLDVVLGLTPDVQDDTKENGEISKGKGKAKNPDLTEPEEESSGWEGGEWGGWEVSIWSLNHSTIDLITLRTEYLVLYGSP